MSNPTGWLKKVHVQCSHILHFIFNLLLHIKFNMMLFLFMVQIHSTNVHPECLFWTNPDPGAAANTGGRHHHG